MGGRIFALGGFFLTADFEASVGVTVVRAKRVSYICERAKGVSITLRRRVSEVKRSCVFMVVGNDRKSL